MNNMTSDEVADKQAILDKATPRPWLDVDCVVFIAGKASGSVRRKADGRLAKLTVNSYEAQAALIEKLTKLLSSAAQSKWLREAWYEWAKDVDATLAEVKKLGEK